MHQDLIAPCGMNCAVCAQYLALQHEVKKKGIRMPYCQGCRPRDKRCAFLKKKCTLLRTHQVQFCFECTQFPCRNLRHLDAHYQTFFHTSFIENLTCIQKKGIDAFLKQQTKKWRCPTCKGTICCHNGLCFHCNIKKLQRKKKRYRWEE